MRMPPRPVALAAALLLIAAPLAWSEIKPRVMLFRAKEQLAERRFSAARQTLREFLQRHGSTDFAAEARVLTARAELLDDKPMSAIETLERFLKTEQDSPLRFKARHLLADAYCKVKKFKDAADLTREHLAFVRGEAYLGKLSGLYLELAEEAWRGEEVETAPGRKELRPNYQRAIEFYSRALQIGVPDETAPVVYRNIATALLETGRQAQAAQTLEILLKRFPKLEKAGEVKLEIARIELAMGRLDAAREGFRELLEDKTLAPAAGEGLGDSYRRSWSSGEETRSLAISWWKKTLDMDPARERVASLRSKLAEAHRLLGRHDEAIADLRAFLEVCDKDDEAGEARFQIAESYRARDEFDQARRSWGAFLGRHPSHRRFSAAQERIANSWIEQGEHLRVVEAGQKLGAERVKKVVSVWQTFLEKYPVHARAAEVRLSIGQLYADAGQTEQALEAWRLVTQRYPRQRVGATAQLKIARTLEQSGDSLAEAIAAYEDCVKNFRGHPESYEAARVLSVMRTRELTMTTPRSFHTGEEPRLKLAARNIPSLTFKAWRLDLVEYFRKEKSIGSVHELAVALVKPDLEWNLDIPAYEPWKKLERDIAMPFKGPGAWVVTAENDEFVATSLVLVTDLVTIVKRSDSQLFVFAHNRRTGDPEPGVEVLAADRGRILETVTTNAEGIAVAKLRASRVRVFASKAGHVACTASRPGSTVSFAYTPKGYIYTDRPIYRPGQNVSWKAILRRVEAGRYSVPSDERCKVSLVDPRGRTLVERPLRTSAVGTLAGSWSISRDATLGDWQIQVRLGNQTFSGTFRIEEYKKPDVLVEITPKTPALLTGEKAEVTIAARNYYGGVVPEAEVQWRVLRVDAPFDASVHRRAAWFRKKTDKTPERRMESVSSGQGTTDKRGRLAIEFATAALDRDCRYIISAEVRGPDRRWVSGSGAISVTRREFYTVLESEKKVVRPEEDFRLLVTTVDATHAPFGARGELRLLRLSAVPGSGRMAESLVQVLPVTTPESGRREMTLQLPKPGEYILRFVGEDRRDTEVESEMRIVAAGEAEDLARQAKVRADREVYKQGETARILINSPLPSSTVLLTMEGEAVLGHRILRMSSRSQIVELPLDERAAPNLFLKVAVATDDGFFEAEDEILVLRFLEVEVKTDKPVYGPEDTVQVTVTTRDQGGNPVPAEVSLAVVDDKVFALGASGPQALEPFFYDQRRRNGVRTASSANWRDRGHVRKQVRELIEEAERAKRNLALALEKEGNLGKLKEVQKALEKLQKMDDRKSELRRRESARGRDMSDMSNAEPAPAESPAMKPKPSRQAMAGKKRAGRGGRPGAPMDMDKSSKDMDAFGGEAEDEEADGTIAMAAASLRERFADTAFWAPTVTTDRSGAATVSFQLPADLTRWRATVRGATAETLVGQATGSLVVTRPVTVSVTAPRFLMSTDAAELRAVAHNRSTEDLKGRFGVTAATGRLGELRGQGIAPIEAGRRRTLTMPLEATGMNTGEVVIDTRFETPKASDAVRTRIPVHPFGRPVRQGFSGELDDAALADFEISKARLTGTAELEIQLLPGADEAILSGLRQLRDFPYGCVEQTVNRFLPMVAARKALRASGRDDAATALKVEEALERGLQRLSALQNGDGGWGWFSGSSSNPSVTGYALLALETLNAERFEVPSRLLQSARSSAWRLLRSRETDADQRAALLYALAVGRQEITAELNRSLRESRDLSTHGTAWLALACKADRRGPNAGALLASLKRSAKSSETGAEWSGASGHGWAASGTEATAWAALALLTHEASSTLVDDAARTLLGRQRAGGWESTKAGGAAILFLSAWCERRERDAINGTLTVELNGKAIGRVDLGVDMPRSALRLKVSDKSLAEGRNRLRLTRTGSGRLFWNARLRYVEQAEAVKATEGLLTMSRRLRADDGGEVAGWSIVHRRDRPNPNRQATLTETVSGRKLAVEVTLTAKEPMSYVMIEDRLPAGLELPAKAASGPFDRFERRDDRAVFFIARLPAGTTRLTYKVHAVTPGRFTTPAGEAILLYEPEISCRSASAVLTVHDDASKLSSAPEKTPDALYQAARKLLEDGKKAEALEAFRGLLRDRPGTRSGGWRLRRQVEVEVVATIFALSRELKNATLTVQAFERLRDLDARRVSRLGGEAMADLVDAYDSIGEHLRAHTLGRDVLLGYFRFEAQLAEVYRRLGRPVPAQNYMSQLLLRYPETASLRRESFELARRYLEIQKPIGDSGASAPMVTEAYAAFKDFGALFPNSPMAARAQLEAARALRKMGDPVGADREAGRVLLLEPRSETREEALYLQLMARMERGEKSFDEAMAVGRELLQLRHKRGRRLVETRYKANVHYQFATIHHVRGELETAVKFYALCKSQIPDAADAWRYLTEVGFTLPGTVSVKTREPARLAVRGKNLDALDLKVYPVDFMTLFLTRKNLDNVHKVNLTGIAPVLSKRVKVKDRTRFSWQELSLDLPVKERGAYLVVGKSGDRDRSSLVLVSDLEIRIQRSGSSLRVYATLDGKPAAGAKVRIGVGQGIAGAGTTDARGIFEARGVRQGAAIVVELDRHLAFHRE